MTKEQISTILTENGEVMDAWTFLPKFKMVGLNVDNNIYNPLYNLRYYFSSSLNGVFVQSGDGNRKEISSTDLIPEGYFSYEINGKRYITKIKNGGIKTAIGDIHEFVTFDVISAMYKC